MTYNAAKHLLQRPIKDLSLKELQAHYVRLIDAWRESKAEYGFKQAVDDGFYVPILCNYAEGFTPKDMFLTSNLSTRMYEVEKLLQQMTSKED